MRRHGCNLRICDGRVKIGNGKRADRSQPVKYQLTGWRDREIDTHVRRCDTGPPNCLNRTYCAGTDNGVTNRHKDFM